MNYIKGCFKIQNIMNNNVENETPNFLILERRPNFLYSPL